MKIFILSLSIFLMLESKAQQLEPDQNPNYTISLQKYMQQKDSLMSYMNSTIQATYKAYDWYEERMERRRVRFNTRQQVRLYRAMYNNDNWWNNSIWNNGWNNNWWWNRFHVGFRTGNWWFGF